jgi:hypothetical protein
LQSVPDVEAVEAIFLVVLPNLLFINKPHSGNIVDYQKNKAVNVPAPREEEPGDGLS